MGSGGAVNPASSCAKPCAGDPSQICGDSWLLSMYYYNASSLPACSPAGAGSGGATAPTVGTTLPATTGTVSPTTTVATTHPDDCSCFANFDPANPTKMPRTRPSGTFWDVPSIRQPNSRWCPQRQRHATYRRWMSLLVRGPRIRLCRNGIWTGMLLWSHCTHHDHLQ